MSYIAIARVPDFLVSDEVKMTSDNNDEVVDMSTEANMEAGCVKMVRRSRKGWKKSDIILQVSGLSYDKLSLSLYKK